MPGSLPGVLFDGVAYGSLLFLISVGLSVTMGLMNFINLAHGAFAMAGGYVCAVAMNRLGVPFVATLPLAFLAGAVAGGILESLLYRRLYRRSPLDQVLFSLGLTLMSVAAATWVFGPGSQPVHLPDFLLGQVRVAGVDLGAYRLFLVAVVSLIALALIASLRMTKAGARIRASVDDAQAAAGLGIDVGRVFALTFTLGSALSALGGALSIDVFGLDPTFPLKYLVYFLLVVVVGGSGSIAGSLLASMVLGVLDVVGKYYVPQIGAFVIYGLMIALLLLSPGGLRRMAR